MLNKNNKKISSRGFTLLETLVAVAILGLAISTTFSVAQSGLSAAFSARDQITSVHLAQEAIEYVRSVRDDNSLEVLNTGSNTPWLSGLESCMGSTCSVDVLTNNISICSAEGCDLYIDSAGHYTHNSSATGAKPTVFRREVRVEEVSPREAKVDVTVSWGRGVSRRSFTITEHLFDWQK